MLLIPRGEFISLRPSSLFPPFVLHSAKLFVCLRYTRGRYFSLPSTVQRVLCICTSALERSVLLTCVDMMEQSTEVEVEKQEQELRRRRSVWVQRYLLVHVPTSVASLAQYRLSVGRYLVLLSTISLQVGISLTYLNTQKQPAAASAALFFFRFMSSLLLIAFDASRERAEVKHLSLTTYNLPRLDLPLLLPIP